jgi:hypothetical protein
MLRRLVAVGVLVLVPALLLAATIKKLAVADGREDSNKVGVAVYDGSKVPPVTIRAIQAGYDKKAKVVRRTGGMMTRGPEYDLDPSIDLGSLFAEALRGESAAMGFRAESGGQAGWEVSGTLKALYAESHQVYMGSTLFYNYMEVELTGKGPAGETKTARYRLHYYYGAYNAGMGRKDEAADGLAHLLLEGAQETLARLNRDWFKAPAHPDIVKRIGALAAGSTNDLHLLGLSGAAEAVPVLLKALPDAKDESRRCYIIIALGRLGAADAVPVLVGRYAAEKEDCRWETLRALDYIGSDQAMAGIREHGLKDGYDAAQRLAKRITGS